MDEQKNLNEEYGLGPEWTPVENTTPINPSRPPQTITQRITDSYLAGSISPSLQHDAYFVQSGYVTTSIASSPLMPVASAGVPANNAGVQQTIKTVTIASSTPPGGSNTAVQFNNGGSFGGDSGFTYDSVTRSIFVGGDFTLGGSFVIGGGISITGNILVSGNATVTGYINSVTGFRYNGTAPLAQYLRGDGTNFISAVLSGSDIATGIVGLTYGGTGVNLSASGSATAFLAQDASHVVSARSLVTADLPAGTGTVTSVALALPATVFTISGSPVTTSGTLTGAFINQSANTIFAGPTTGGATTPAFRALVAADIPNLDASKITTGQLALARGGTHADLSGTGGTSQVLRQSSLGADITVSQLSYSDISGVSPAPISASVNLTAQGANVAATTLFAVVSAGLYRITVYMVVSRAATTTSTMPDSQIIFTDEDSNATITANLTAGDSGNTTSTFAQSTFIVNAKASTNIQYAIGQVTAFASSGGTSMQFVYRARVEYLG